MHYIALNMYIIIVKIISIIMLSEKRIIIYVLLLGNTGSREHPCHLQGIG